MKCQPPVNVHQKLTSHSAQKVSSKKYLDTKNIRVREWNIHISYFFLHKL